MTSETKVPDYRALYEETLAQLLICKAGPHGANVGAAPASEPVADFPCHPEPHSYAWTALERATITAFGAQQRQEGRRDMRETNIVLLVENCKLSAKLAARAMPQVKDHVLREVVNNLRDIAIKFHAAGQLRERLRGALDPLLSVANPPKDYFGQKVTSILGEIREAKSMPWRDSLLEDLLELIDPSPAARTLPEAPEPAQQGAEPEWNSMCGCRACNREFIGTVMFLCAACGNKRCPHATNHAMACTGSNEPGQPGSSYA